MSPQAFLNTFKVFSYISSENSESLQKIWLKAVVWNLSSPPFLTLKLNSSSSNVKCLAQPAFRAWFRSGGEGNLRNMPCNAKRKGLPSGKLT